MSVVLWGYALRDMRPLNNVSVHTAKYLATKLLLRSSELLSFCRLTDGLSSPERVIATVLLSRHTVEYVLATVSPYMIRLQLCFAVDVQSKATIACTHVDSNKCE